MYCSRRLYKGNAYEICLPIADTGITVVRFYTRGDIILEKEPETTGDSMCFSFTEEDLASLEDGVLRYGYDDFDTNSPYVVVTPGDYSGSTLDDLLEDAFDSGYTAGQEDCSGGTCEDGLIANLQGDRFYIPEGTNKVRNFAFYYARISAITIPDSVRSIQNAAFYGNNLSAVTIPGSVTSVGAEAFCANDNLVTLILENGVKYLREKAFCHCNLTGVTLPSSVRSIGKHCFAENRNLTGVTIPDSVTSLGEEAFQDCESLQNVEIGSGITQLAARTFLNCYSLTSITVPETITEIGDDVFWACSGLTSMTFIRQTPPTISDMTRSLGQPWFTFPIYVPSGSVEAYKTAFGQYYAPRIQAIQ